ncbi:Ribosomal protein S10 [Fasciola gigantica]|uniref:Ribosomal protein S10 n=1 Tax=Fasciola gigantica TaxID=46835 RepID=A0A504YVP2_FASGI|nr:Ribosomal protein S10 [Fasciola gigantica]
MLLPVDVRNSIYEKIIQDGVLCARNDIRPCYNHPTINVRNLFVIKTMRSLKSKGCVREQYAWRTYYWFLNNDGITYLREVLHLPSDIIPATMKAPARDPRLAGMGMEHAAHRGPTDGRVAFRRGPVAPTGAPFGAPEKEGATVGEGEVHFRGGYGRGRPM